MRYRMSRRVLLALVAFVTCALAMGTAFAQEATDSDASGTNELVVNAVDSMSDITDANVQVKVYRIAAGQHNGTYDTYDYSLVDPFTGLAQKYDLAAMSQSQWGDMATEAQQIATDAQVEPDRTGVVGQPISNLPDGVYLVLLPEAKSGLHVFTFSPTIVTLPGKVDANDQPVYNTSAGRWTNTDPQVPVQIVAKPSVAPRYGRLRIDKSVTGFAGEAATFVYHIVGTQPDNKKYETYAAVKYTAEGTQSATVGHIPAGTKLTVTEVYTGARYQLVSDADQTATIVADGVVPVTFQNEKNDSGTGGHGIENHFVYDSNYNGGDWHLEVHAIDASEVGKGDVA